MVEPNPPALHLLSSGDVSMAGVGVKVEQDESSGGGRIINNAEPPKTSPSRDWSGNQPLEARQLTPPLSRSPSVRISRKAWCERLSTGVWDWYVKVGSLFFLCLSIRCSLFSVLWQEGSPGKELPHRQSPTEARTHDRPEGQSNFKEGLSKLLTQSLIHYMFGSVISRQPW